MATLKLLALAVVVALSTVSARPADACSSSECGRGYFVPGDGTTVPANLPVLYWVPMYSDSVTTGVRLTTATAPGTPLPFTATQLDNGDYVLRPDSARRSRSARPRRCPGRSAR